MIIKYVVEEDFINYKKPSMFIGCPYCSFKCNKEFGREICQNYNLSSEYSLNIPNETIVQSYLKNDISKAIVFGGLEPLDSIEDVLNITKLLRKYSDDDIVIYTGYTEQECLGEIPLKSYMVSKESLVKGFKDLISLNNIVVKFGRYIPNVGEKFDEILGVTLASNNQYAKEYKC